MDNISFAQRMVGAIILLSLAIIFVPLMLEGESKSGSGSGIRGTNIPSMPDNVSTIVFQLDNEGVFRALDEQLAQGREVSIVEAKKSPEKKNETTEERGTQTNTAGDMVEPIDPDLTTWVVQLGSFSDEGNAVNLRDQLRKKQFAAFVKENRSPTGVIWQVRVGPEKSAKRAQELKQILEKDTGLQALVIRHPG